MNRDLDLFGKPYLGDARLDRMMGIIFALSGEVAMLKSEVARLAGRPVDEGEIDREMAAFAREILKPLSDPDFDPAKRNG